MQKFFSIACSSNQICNIKQKIKHHKSWHQFYFLNKYQSLYYNTGITMLRIFHILKQNNILCRYSGTGLFSFLYYYYSQIGAVRSLICYKIHYVFSFVCFFLCRKNQLTSENLFYIT